jgi:ferritin-like metal-binding protein YciE
MKLKDLDSLFVHQLKDLYGAEKKLTKALPKMAKAATDDSLHSLFEEHEQESKGQINRLERIFKECDINTRGAKCPGMNGLIEEADELITEGADPEVLDAALICAAQRVEHYEIAAYGCARALAEQLGRNDFARELGATLEEEKKANEKLNELALGHINREAMHSGSQSGNGGMDDEY